MEKSKLTFLMGCLLFGLVTHSCSKEGDHTVPSYNGNTTTADMTTTPYDWEKSRTAILGSTDMVLIYGGGHHRSPYYWDKDRFKSYVIYVDANQKSHWMFDSFLFLEIMDKSNGGTEKMFAKGYSLESANQQDWANLIDYYFQSTTGLGALDASIEDAKSVLGTPQQKHQVVIAIPEPIVYQNPSLATSSTQYWGKIDNKTLNFLDSNDRLKACKWYIDQVRAKFNAMQYKNIELAGFYWLAEKSTDTSDIMSPIASYLNKLKYSFNWIPFYGAAGYNQWKSYGFNYAYLQPNYFFSTTIIESRLKDACNLALSYNMDMELEFDDNALASRGKADRLRSYMSAFKQYGIWEKKRLAYYQGSSSLLTLKNSSVAADKQLYYDFCDFVVTRPIRVLK
jgi:hypothetical protein